MKEAIAKIGRENHQKHLTSVMPLIVAVFGVQCFIMFKMGTGIEAGDYALGLGIGLASFISLLFVYDNYHHAIIYKDHLHIYFPLTMTNKTIEYSNIERIITAKEEDCSFSNMVIKTKDKKTHVLFFVDHPTHVKELIESQFTDENYEQDMAA